MKNTSNKNLLKIKKESRQNTFYYLKLLVASTLAISLTGNLNVTSKPLINSIPDKSSSFSSTSFITEAVEKTGASVVTIDTQKFVG